MVFRLRLNEEGAGAAVNLRIYEIYHINAKAKASWERLQKLGCGDGTCSVPTLQRLPI